MKWLIIPAAALGLTIVAPAYAAPNPAASRPVAQNRLILAQRDRNRDRDRDRDQDRHRDRRGQDTQQHRGSAVQQHRGNRGPAVRQREQRHRVEQRHRTEQRHQAERRHQRYNWGEYRAGHRPPGWDRHRSNFNHRPWLRNYRSAQRYHWGRYHRPHGWYYRRWVFGAILPTIFWTRDYWITSYWRFGLMDPPYGYVWVRYGDDAVLVDVETGYILRVAYGVFY